VPALRTIPATVLGKARAVLLSISRHAPLFQPRLAEIEAAAAEEEHDENDED
jgi:hypothetical protein